MTIMTTDVEDKPSQVIADIQDKHPGQIIILVVDSSGSMAKQQSQTIHALNGFVEEQRSSRQAAREDEVFMSLVTFNDDVVVQFSCVEIRAVPVIDERLYSAFGSTALFDAVGRTILTTTDAIKGWQDKPAILVVVLTDGYENSSIEFGGTDGRKKINALINQKQEEGNWTFVFLGATLDTHQVADSLGFSAGNVKQYSGDKVSDTLKQVSRASVSYSTSVRTTGATQVSDFSSRMDDD